MTTLIFYIHNSSWSCIVYVRPHLGNLVPYSQYKICHASFKNINHLNLPGLSLQDHHVFEPFCFTYIPFFWTWRKSETKHVHYNLIWFIELSWDLKRIFLSNKSGDKIRVLLFQKKLQNFYNIFLHLNWFSNCYSNENDIKTYFINIS